MNQSLQMQVGATIKWQLIMNIRQGGVAAGVLVLSIILVACTFLKLMIGARNVWYGTDVPSLASFQSIHRQRYDHRSLAIEHRPRLSRLIPS